MRRLAILTPKVEPQDVSHTTDLLDSARVDYSDLIQLTLANWQNCGNLPEDNAALEAALEHYLAVHASRAVVDYEHFRLVVSVLVGHIQRFYEGLNEQLGPLLELYGVDVELHLTKHLYRDIVVRIEPKVEL